MLYLSTKEKYRKYALICLILLLGFLIIKVLWPFVNGLMAAFTIFVLVRQQMVYLTKKRNFNKNLSTVLILLEVIAIIIVPVFFLSSALIGKIQTINVDITVLTEIIQQFEKLIKDRFDYDLLNMDTLNTLSGYLTKAVQFIVGQASGLVISFIVMIFLLYFMLVDYLKMEQYVLDLLPFNEQNRDEIAREIFIIVRSNAIGIPLLAIFQGLIAYFGYLFFGVPSALFFAFLACFATIIPLVGGGLVWVPLMVYLAIIGDWYNAIGLAICYVVFVVSSDNLFRLIIQKKLANIHPLITVFGVFFGLSVFGFWGIIFGPLLLSMLFLLIKIFKREYLDKVEN